MPRHTERVDDSDEPTETAAETWYTVTHNGLTVHTQDASAADHASRRGAHVTATTRGESA